METLKVSSKSEPRAVAGAIAAIMRNGETAEITGIGAGAVNQMVKSIAVARGYVAQDGFDLVCAPAFSQSIVDGNERTSMCIVVERR